MIEKIESIRRLNLQKLIDSNGGVNRLAEILDKNQGYLSGIKNATRPFTEKFAREVERTLNIPLGYLDKLDNDVELDTAYIPEYKAKLSAGSGCEVVDQDIIRHIPLLKSEIKMLGVNENNLAIFTVDGDSMLPALVSDERVLIDRSKTEAIDNRIFAICRDNVVLIKRLFIHPTTRKVLVTSQNEAFKRFDFEANDGDKIIGMAIQTLGRKLY